MDFSLCVSTFRRPDMLARLLECFVNHDYGELTGEFIFVDNDPAGSALPLFDGWQERLPFPMRVLHAPQQNIALARNAAVAVAQGDWIAVIDDDEWPEPGWLLALFEGQRRYAADAVFGPVIPHYAADVPDWIQQAGYFAPRKHASGDILQGAQTYTSNVLIRRAALAGIPGPFDAEFGLTGGSDAMLFWDMEQRGAKLVWYQEAPVHETVPRSRANFPWLLRRAYSGGQIYIRVETGRLDGAERTRRQLGLGARAVLQLGASAVLSVLCLPFSRGRSVHWMRKASAQLGKLSGIAGSRYGAYDPGVKRRAN